MEEREELLRRKDEIEKEIKNVERSNMHSQLSSALNNLGEISQEVAIAQDSLNGIWRRVEKIEEEVKSIILKYCEPSHHQQNLLKQSPSP
jgi:archaellum component FlaC